MEPTTLSTKKTSSESTLMKEKQQIKANILEMVDMIADINDELGIEHTMESEFDLWELTKTVTNL